jgi:hypothetical protein
MKMAKKEQFQSNDVKHDDDEDFDLVEPVMAGRMSSLQDQILQQGQIFFSKYQNDSRMLQQLYHLLTDLYKFNLHDIVNGGDVIDVHSYVTYWLDSNQKESSETYAEYVSRMASNRIKLPRSASVAARNLSDWWWGEKKSSKPNSNRGAHINYNKKTRCKKSKAKKSKAKKSKSRRKVCGRR